MYYAMKKKTLAEILKNYPNKWVSLTENYQKVIASGTNLKSVVKQLAKLGNPKGVLIRSGEDYSRYAGTNHTDSHKN